MKNHFSIRTILANGALCLLLSAGICRADLQPDTLLVSTTPSGAFHLEVDMGIDSPIWLVPKDHPSARAALQVVSVFAFKKETQTDSPPEGKSAEEPAKQVETTSDKLDPVPVTFISPDERWIFVAQHTCVPTEKPYDDPESYSIGYLYRRMESAPGARLDYELATPERLDILAYRYLAQEEKIETEHIRTPDETGIRTRSIFFAGWSPDSSRVLLALNYDTGADATYRDIRHWLCYYNTRTGAFERTERLLAADRIAMTAGERPHGVEEVLHAESIGQEGPVVPAKELFAKADAELNEVYGKLLKQIKPAAQAKLREEERTWIGERDTFAAVRATQSWSPFFDASIVEGQAILTDARVKVLRGRLSAK